MKLRFFVWRNFRRFHSIYIFWLSPDPKRHQLKSKMASGSQKNDEINSKMSKMTMKMTLSDCECPVCLYIIIEPVTMPCGHELCIDCFRKNVQEASLTCPMCRLRISTWARKAARNNTLINQARWDAIKRAFPKRVQNRMAGIEEEPSPDNGECVLT